MAKKLLTYPLDIQEWISKVWFELLNLSIWLNFKLFK